MKQTMLVVCVASGLALGCGDDDGGGTDGGTDAAVDARVDAGFDAGFDSGTDSGFDASMGCEEGCGLEELALGAAHACARRANGEVLCWGWNRFGQLGDGRRGHADCTGIGGTEIQDCSPEPVVVADVVATAITSNSGLNTCGLQADGVIWCWGLSDFPPPGSDQREQLFFPEQIATFSPDPQAVETRNGNTCTITAAGGVECWGDNSSGQVGDGTFVEKIMAVPVADLSGVVELDLGSGQFACARTADALFCWGSNRSGQLGDGTGGVGTHGSCGETGREYDCSADPVQVAGFTTDAPTGLAAQVDLGLEHACAVTADGQLWCWGNNDAGQLGTGDTTATNAPVQVPGITSAAQVALGVNNTCVRLSDGSVQCWGANDEGQVGDGMPVGTHDECAVFSETIDCVLAPTDVTLPAPAVDVAAAGRFTCALLDDGRVFCWGENERRQLGPNGPDDRTRSTAPVEVVGFE